MNRLLEPRVVDTASNTCSTLPDVHLGAGGGERVKGLERELLWVAGPEPDHDDRRRVGREVVGWGLDGPRGRGGGTAADETARTTSMYVK